MTGSNPTQPSQNSRGFPTPQGIVASLVNKIFSEYRWLRGNVVKTFRWLWRQVAKILEPLLNLAFAVTRGDGILRYFIFLLGPLALWIGFTLHFHQILYWDKVVSSFKEAALFFLQPDALYSLMAGTVKFFIYLGFFLLDLVLSMFSANIFRHVIAIGVPAFVAVRIATLYLTDIFELERERIALHFIGKAAFGLFYSRITISDTRVEPDDSPMLKIGGPGVVQVNLENAAVFDRINGEPHVIPPTVPGRSHVAVIDSFERFREAVDLRDQIVERGGVEILGRTRDGIRITAKDIRMIFSVLRQKTDQPLPASANGSQALTYDEEALKRLVYNRAFGYSAEPWPLVMIDLVNRRMQKFIATHELSWFLAAADVPDFRTSAAPAAPSGAAPTPDIYAIKAATESMRFTSRSEITQYFFGNNSDFVKDADLMGAQLHWIDVGTWATTARIISERQLEAWRISSNNQTRKENLALNKEEGKVDEMLILVRGVPLIAFRQSRFDKKSQDEICKDLLAAYLGILRQAYDSYAVDKLASPPPELETAIKILIACL